MGKAKEKTVPVRQKLVARPQENADMAALRADINQRFSKTLEHLAR